MGNMSYTYSITSKGQVTIPLEFRRLLGLDTLKKATFRLNSEGEVVVEAPKDLAAIRAMLQEDRTATDLTERERIIGGMLAKKYGVR